MRYEKQSLSIGENTRMALATLLDHKVRSILTVLGVVIAVIVLIMVFSILYGFDKDVRAYLEDYGPETLFIQKFDAGIHLGNLTPEERQRKPFVREDANAILEECPSVRNAFIEIASWSFDGREQAPPTARVGAREVYSIHYSGVTPSYEAVMNAHMYKGRFFSDAEDLHRADAAVLGYDLADTLFPGGDAVGQTVMVAGQSYEIIGVLEKRKGALLRGSEADKEVLVPYRTFQKHRPNNKETFMAAQAYPGKKAAAEDEMRAVLRRRRNDSYYKPDSFGITSAEALASQLRQIMSTIALLTIVVSSIGLLVGGVGVMNIMLMAVTERTHEIGVRKAIGARRADVIRQFLIEAVVMTGLGGVVGVIVAIIFIGIVNLAFPNFPAAVPAWAVGVSVCAAMSVGLFFGVYPAMKASSLDPVDALRYE